MSASTPRILLFSAMETLSPLIHALHTENTLGGVVFGPRLGPGARRLQEELSAHGVRMLNYLPDHQPEVVDLLKEWACDTALIYGFPIILPETLISLFPRGVYNLHPSPLPAYRGPQPLFWQIRNNERQSALTLHRVTSDIDAGPIVDSHPVSIHPHDTYGALEGEFLLHAAHMTRAFSRALAQCPSPRLPETPQAHAPDAPTAPRPTPQTARIDWARMTPASIAALARAASPAFHGAHTDFNGAPLHILQAEPCDHPLYGTPPGSLLCVDEETGLTVAAKEGALRVDILSVPAGTFTGARFALRFGLEAGMRLGHASSAPSPSPAKPRL